MRQLIAGNWKMNGLRASVREAQELAAALAREPSPTRVAVCPPATLVTTIAKAVAGSDVLVGGQDCHAEAFGAFTGDISAEMLADAGAQLVILAHSERRTLHGETDEMASAKAKAALRAELEPIICVGETLDERRAGRTLEVVERQTRGSVPQDLREAPFALAYEPVWAIGTGLTPTNDQIEEVHAALRRILVQLLGGGGAQAPILYGGSVKPANAAEILALPEVGGALVGGASLKCEDFLAIVRAAP
jgi:triosephosphate isomerase